MGLSVALLPPLLAAIAVGVSGANPNLAQSVLLMDAVATHGARCLDGTPQRYWLQESTSSRNASKWVIHFMGGGWCESVEDCANRAYGYQCYIGSSNPECLAREASAGNGIPGVVYSDVMDFADIPSCLGARWCGGLFTNDSATNPVSWDWNKVLVSYCDGGSYAGNNGSVTTTVFNGTEVPLYFRGFRNMQAVLDDLIASHGLGAASDVVVTGDSAGGLATYWHVDYVASLVPAARVVGVPDSGFFYNYSAFPAWPAALRWVVAYGNSSAGLHQGCVSARAAAGADPLDCALPEVTAPYVLAPLFVMNSRFDPALDSISGGESGANTTTVNDMGAALYSLVKSTVLTRPANAAFLTSCHEHCGQWGQDQGGPFADFNVTIDGWSAMPALASWLRGDAGRSLWFQPAQYPCASCCSGGQHR